MELISGTNGKYGIERCGTVWRLKGTTNWKGQTPPYKVNDHDNGNGYRYVQINRRPKYVHRLVAETYIPNPENLKYVGHKDHDKTNNKSSNLYWTTSSGNTTDGIKDGKINYKRRIKGKMKDHSDQILCQAYTEVKKGAGITNTGKKYNINRTTLSSWINKRSRKELTDSLDTELKDVL